MTKETKENMVNFWHFFAGVVMVFMGFYIWLNPTLSLLALALYLGVCFLVVGAGYLMASFHFESGWYAFVGLLDVLIGAILVSNLGITAATLPIILGFWCLAVGAAQFVTAFQFHKMGLPWNWALVSGALGIIFGFLILTFPVVGAFTISTLLALYIILYGTLAIAESTYLYKLK